MKDQKPLVAKIKAARRALDALLAELDEDQQEEEAIGTCLICGKPILSGERKIRGVHHACYLIARKRIARGETTDAQLEKEGLLEPAKKGGRPRRQTKLDFDLTGPDTLAAADRAAETVEKYRKKKRTPRKGQK